MSLLKTSKPALGPPNLLFSVCPGSSSGTKRPKREANHSIHLVQRLTLEDIYIYIYIYIYIPLQHNAPSLQSQGNLYFFFEEFHASLIGEKRLLVSGRYAQLYRTKAFELTYTYICPQFMYHFRRIKWLDHVFLHSS